MHNIKKHNRYLNELIYYFAVLLRNSQFHDINNIAVKTSINNFLSSIKKFISKEEILAIDLIGESFYINNERVKFIHENFLNYNYLARELIKREIGKMIFNKDITIKDINILLNAL